ncbi:MAG TPA: hypothetical protein VGL09_15640 [Methylomirabilota bacterium]
MAALFTACATKTAPVEYKGSGGPVAWVVDNPTVQFYPNNRLKWLYRLRLQETAGIGVVLTHVSRVTSGYGVNTTTAERNIDLVLAPREELTLTCAQSIISRTPSATAGRYEVNVVQRYSGKDARGRPFTFTTDITLDRWVPAREARVLDFARVTARSGGSAGLSCETIPDETRVFDLRRHTAVHLLVAVDNTRTRIPIRTRWLSPRGREVRVITGVIRTDEFSSTEAFIHTTHSVPTSLMARELGAWKVELYLEGKPEGVYPFEVWREP